MCGCSFQIGIRCGSSQRFPPAHFSGGLSTSATVGEFEACKLVGGGVCFYSLLSQRIIVSSILVVNHVAPCNADFPPCGSLKSKQVDFDLTTARMEKSAARFIFIFWRKLLQMRCSHAIFSRLQAKVTKLLPTFCYRCRSMPPTDARFPESVRVLLDALSTFVQVCKPLSSPRACQVCRRD